VTSCVEPGPQGPACGPILYQETFGSAGQGWVQETTSDSRSEIEGGRYRIELLKGWTDARRWNEEEGPYADFCFSAKVWALPEGSTTDVGLLFRCADAGHFYLFSIRPSTGTAGLARAAGERVTPIHFVSTDAVRGVGEANELQVIAQGSRFRMYVNGELVLEETDTSFSAGFIGVYARVSSDEPAEVAFDDVVVREVK
jgi:hypothetical protein